MSVYKKLARAVDKVARRAVDLERQEEARLRALSARLEETRMRSLTDASQAAPSVWRKRRALLIVNSKSGPNRDSLLRVRDLAELLGAYNIAVEVRVKLSKSQATKEARAAADGGFKLVIAAGGDGTVESVARGLVDTGAALGIVPLGTYNNIAHCLGVPTDPAAACALIASRSPRPIDVGQVEARGRRKPRTFLELATVGLGAILTPLGQHVEKGRLIDAAGLVPDVVNMAPSGMLMRLDDAPAAWWGDALLLTISNTPRAGAALQLAPEALVDDGLLDIVLYDGLRQSDLLARVGDLRNGTATHDARLRHARVRSIEVHTQQPMAVAADSKVVGVTPARFTVRTGALLAIVGHGPGLGRPPSAAVPLPMLETANASAPNGTGAEHARQLVPGQAMRLARAGAVPLAAALVAAAALPVARAVQKRVEHR